MKGQDPIESRKSAVAGQGLKTEVWRGRRSLPFIPQHILVYF